MAGGCIFIIDSTSTNKNNTVINIEDGDYFGSCLVGLQGNAKVNITGGKFLGGYAPTLVLGGGLNSEISMTDFTSDSTDTTDGSAAGMIIGTNGVLVNKVKLNSGSFKYKAGKLSMNTWGTATKSDAIIYGGKFGPDTGVSNANKQEITNLLAPLKKVVEITDATDLANGYYYKVEDVPIQCKIGSVEYADLQSAINAVQNAQTITMIQDVTYDTPILINNGKRFTIDFMDGSTQHSFRWFDMGGSQTDKDVFIISNGSNVTVKNMKYLVGAGEHNNRVFKVNSTGTITLNDFKSSASDSVQDTIVYNNGGTVNINNGQIESIVEKMFVQNAGTFNIGGSSLSCKINNELYNIIYIGDGNTDENLDAGTVNINDGDFQIAQLLQINAKAKININKAKSDNGYGYIFVKEYGKKSNISINNYTIDTYGDAFIKIWNTTMDTKIAINGGKYKYGQGYFCKDESSGSPLFEVSLKGGLFGPDSGATTDAYNELSNLLAPNCVLQTLSSTHPEYANGYFYEIVYVPPTPTPTPRPYIPSGGSGGSSGGGFSGGIPKYGLNDDIIGPSGINNNLSILPNLNGNISVFNWNYNTANIQVADIHYVQSIDSFVRGDNLPVVTEWIGVIAENSSKMVWYRTDVDGRLLRNQFIQLGDNIYYFDKNGIMVIGDFQINGKIHRFDTTDGPTEGRLISIL